MVDAVGKVGGSHSTFYNVTLLPYYREKEGLTYGTFITGHAPGDERVALLSKGTI